MVVYRCTSCYNDTLAQTIRMESSESLFPTTNFIFYCPFCKKERKGIRVMGAAKIRKPNKIIT